MGTLNNMFTHYAALIASNTGGGSGGAVIRREGAYCIFIDEPLASETLGVVLVRGKRRKNSFMTYDNQISFSKFKYFFIYLPVFSGNVYCLNNYFSAFPEVKDG